MDKFTLYDRIRTLQEKLETLDNERNTIKSEIDIISIILKSEYGKSSLDNDNIIKPKRPIVPSDSLTRLTMG